MSSEQYTTRRRAARVILSIGALFKLFLIAGLPLFSMDWEAWRSFVSLFALLAMSIGSAIALRRWGRQAVAVLTVGSAYAAMVIAWSAVVTSRQLSNMTSPASPAQILSLVLALGTFATLPIALAFAWPLRLIVAGYDSDSNSHPA
jgi:hypothetical protein